jgi:hypothetical protein
MKEVEVQVVEWRHENYLKCDGLKATQFASTILLFITVFSAANSLSDPGPPSARCVFKLHRKFT